MSAAPSGETVHAHQPWIATGNFVYYACCNCGWRGPGRWRWVLAHADQTAHIGGSDVQADA